MDLSCLLVGCGVVVVSSRLECKFFLNKFSLCSLSGGFKLAVNLLSSRLLLLFEIRTDAPRVGLGQPQSIPLFPIHFPTSPSSALSFTFHFFPFLLALFFYFSIPSVCTRIGSLRFQARGGRRQPNLGLVFLC